jgi:hypothetical protein
MYGFEKSICVLGGEIMAYTLTGRKGGTVRFEPLENGLVESESESYSSTVTSNPIENGSDINDHVNNDAGTFSVSGTIIGGDSTKNALMAMRDTRDIMTYTGMTRVSNLVFTALKFDRSYKNKDGSAFSATFKRVQTTSPEYVPMGEVRSMSVQDTGKSSNKQLSKTNDAGTKTIAVQEISAASSDNYKAAYKPPSSSAPLSRVTGSYSGIA